jgi:hypothetical protein
MGNCDIDRNVGFWRVKKFCDLPTYSISIVLIIGDVGKRHASSVASLRTRMSRV